MALSPLAARCLCACALAALASCFDEGTDMRMLSEIEQPRVAVTVSLAADFVYMSLEYLDYAQACVPLDTSAYVEIDGVPIATITRGERSPADGACLGPTFSDRLPPSTPRSTITVGDDSARLIIDVDGLLENPTIELEGELIVGSTATVRVTNSTKIEYAYVLFRSDFREWEAPVEIMPDNRLRFEVPFSPWLITMRFVLVSHKKATCGDLASCVVEQIGIASLPETI